MPCNPKSSQKQLTEHYDSLDCSVWKIENENEKETRWYTTLKNNKRSEKNEENKQHREKKPRE